MLFLLTAVTDYLGMTMSLWLAAYILVRGATSRIVLRAVVVLLSITAFFVSAFIHTQTYLPGSAAWRASFLTLGLTFWYDLAFNLLPPARRRRLRWLPWLIYGLTALMIARLLLIQDIWLDDPGNLLGVSRLRPGLSYLTYGLFQGAVVALTLYNFHLLRRAGGGPHHRHFFWATVFAAIMIGGYVAYAFASPVPLPRLIQDGVLMAALLVFGYSVARYQALVERRTTLQDLVLSGVGILGLSALYLVIVQGRGLSPAETASLTLLVVLTHSAYDSVRDFLDRVFLRRESALRQQLRRLARDVGGDTALPTHLYQGLVDLCRTVHAAGGFVAVREGTHYVVAATLHSLPQGETLRAEDVTSEDLRRPPPALAETVAWLAPAFAGTEQVAVVGLGPRTNRANFGDRALDLLTEMADWAGRMIYVGTQQKLNRTQLIQLASEVQAAELGLQAGPEDLLSSLENQPDPIFVQQVEECLRHLAEYATLGEARLALQLELRGGTHIERGKAVRQAMLGAIDSLRPAGARPGGVLPREWHSYAILHDAYVEDVPNREIMARLYISEGTFNRQRRKALQAIARALLETRPVPSAEPLVHGLSA